jgi:isopentenyl phosphate kinase
MIYHFKLAIGDIHSWVTIFWTKDSRTLFLLSSKYKIYMEKNKCKILNNSNYINFHGGGDFSHPYVIMHQYFGKKSEMQKMNTSNFTNNLTFFLA